MTIKEYVAVSIVMCILVYLTATITDRRHEQHEQTAVENAISTFEPSPLNCDDQNAISAIKSLAENGAHISHFDVDVYWEYKEGQ